MDRDRLLLGGLMGDRVRVDVRCPMTVEPSVVVWPGDPSNEVEVEVVTGGGKIVLRAQLDAGGRLEWLTEAAIPQAPVTLPRLAELVLKAQQLALDDTEVTAALKVAGLLPGWVP